MPNAKRVQQAKELIAQRKKLKEGWVLDDKEAFKDTSFAIGYTKDFRYIGLTIPKNVSIKDKQGKIIGYRQINAPAILTSAHELLDHSYDFERDHKLKFNSIPDNIPLRISLSTIKKFLDIKYIDPTFKEVYEQIIAEYSKYCYYFSREWYMVNALWDIGTYFFMLFPAYPLFEHRGGKGTAKSKSMVISRCFTFNATRIWINPSESTMFRETHAFRPTKYIDEAEKLFTFRKGGAPESDSRVEFINSSYTQDGSVPRQESNGKTWNTVYYNSYSPTRIASIRGLYGATEDRAIVQTHTKPPKNDSRGEMEPPINMSDSGKSQLIRDKLYLLYLTKSEDVVSTHAQIRNPGLKNRDWQLWKPLLTIASLIDSNLYAECADFAARITDIKHDDELSKGTFDYVALAATHAIITGTEYNGKLRLKALRQKYIELSEDDIAATPKEKRFSSVLDRVGFRELRTRDNEGSYFALTLKVFQDIIDPLYPNAIADFSSQSSQSSQNPSKEDIK